ncbi:CHAT domain-containing tetratricopeptide repeat protein [Mucilaginibacter paludis]|uniref:Tetratricopeptide TPR_1 repeat-containing protein n=1 Tax=Mucilaginibacter paludis DSM 18603 TaxID=714943 RepID=H1YAF2_9SPHI|nr:CHAT domain-containing protein [Mucilaginibacter paludis]EHQ26995.1 Tetratricopeptide TPR_1 repeat-containing protein [Mucilaginibacter paludis DSM 18603]
MKQFYCTIITALIICITAPVKAQSCAALADSTVKIYRQDGPVKAAPLAEKACKVCQTEQDQGGYMNALRNLATIVSDTGNVAKALSLYNEALRISTKLYPDGHMSTVNILMDLSTLVRLDTGIAYLKQARGVVQKITNGQNSYDYARVTNNIARLYTQAGFYEEAKKYLKEALTAEGSLPNPSNSEVTWNSLNIGAVLSADMGDYQTALEVYDRLSKVYWRKYNSDPSPYLSVQNNLGGLYYKLSNYKKAAEIFTGVKEKFESLQIVNNDYVDVLGNLAVCFSESGQTDKAIPLFDKVIELSRNLNDDELYANTISDKASCYAQQKQFDNAITLLKEALTIRKNLYHNENELYLQTLGSLASCLRDSGNIVESVVLSEKILQILPSVVGPASSDYASHMQEAALCYWAQGNLVKTGSLLKNMQENLNNQVKNNFYGFNSQQREQLITSFYSSFQFDAAYVALLNKQHNTSFNGWLFDIELARKNMLLSTNKRFTTAIETSQDTTLQRMYERWNKLSINLAKQYSLPRSARVRNLDSLQTVKDNLERKIALQSKEFRAEVEKGTVTWQQVRDVLKPGEAAIEFIKYDGYNKDFTDSVFFAALVIKHGDTLPSWVSLCNSRELIKVMRSTQDLITDQDKVNALYGSKDRADNRLYRLLWLPVSAALSGVTTVYYAPTSVLNNVAFPAMRTSSGKYLVEVYDMVQLSSTRNFIQRQPDFKITAGMKATLFGAINYNDFDNAAPRVKPEKEIIPGAARGLDRDYVDGKSWEFLPGTEKEIRAVDTILKAAQIKVSIWSENHASEERLKSLNGINAPDILQISTHGFYFENKSAAYSNVFTRTIQQNLKYSPDPLQRSGLLFSGANKTWMGEQVVSEREDGILTAAEITNLNLSKVGLVVMSACRTALGDISGDESAYGLESATKLAGAKNTIMSLWRISDTESPVFMTNIYHYLAQNNSLHEAFRKTQLLLSKQLDPYYWAAFSLSD